MDTPVILSYDAYRREVPFPTDLPWGGTAKFGVELEGVDDDRQAGLIGQKTYHERFKACTSLIVQRVGAYTDERLTIIEKDSHRVLKTKKATYTSDWIITGENSLTEKDHQVGLEVIS